MRVALAQLDVRLGDVEANERRARDAIAEAERGGADLVVFPELFLSGYALGGGLARETARPAEALARLADGTAALVGFHEPGHNSAAWIEGREVVHVHRKLALVDYPPFDEDELFEPGEELRAFETRFGRVAVLICNDAWQPFLPWLAVADGAQVLLFPSASSGAVPEAEAYWRELTRFYARMLETYVVFVNRVGEEAGFAYWGGSHVVDPLGEIVAEAPRLDEAIVFADLDVSMVEARRRSLPLLSLSGLELARAQLERLVEKGVHESH